MFGTTDLIQLVVGILALFPSFVLFSNYNKTKLIEFLFMGITFISVSFNQFLSILFRQGIINVLLPRTLANWFVIWSSAIFFGLLIHERIINRISIFSGVVTIFYFGLFILYNLFSNSELLSYLYNEELSEELSGFPLIVQIVRLLIFTYGAYIFLDISLPVKSVRNIRLQKLMALGCICISIYPVFVLSNLIFLTNLSLLLPRIFNLLALLIWGSIAIRYPEALVLPLTPYVRSKSLYNKVKQISIDESTNSGIKSLVSYVKSIPAEFVED